MKEEQLFLAIVRLLKHIGYGRMMQIISHEWYRHDSNEVQKDKAMIIELNVNQIITEAESFTSPYDATTEEELNLMQHNGERVLNQLKALKYAMDADQTNTYANKIVRVFACTKQIENMLLVIEDARGDLKNA